MKQPESPPGGEAHGRLVFLVVALCGAVFLLSALQTLVVPLVNDIGRTLDVSPGAASWVLTANLLAAAVSTPLLGRLGDRIGRRVVLLLILGIVLIGSLLAAATHDFSLLIVGRVLQGTSYGIFPVVVGIVRQEVPARKAHGVMANISGMLAVGGGVALVATGLLTDGGGDYRRVFWLSAAVTVVCLVMVWFAVPSRPAAREGRTDWGGAALLAATLVLLLTPLSEGNDWGWGSGRVIGCFAGAAVALVVFLLVERATADPLVPTRFLTHRPLAIANLVGLALGIGLFVVFLGISDFVGTPRALAGYGFSAGVLSTSLVYLLPASLSGVVSGALGGALLSRFGAKSTLVLGMIVLAAAMVALAIFHARTWEVIVEGIAGIMAVVCGYAAAPALISEHVDVSQTGLANSLNSVFRSVGSALASALIVTLLTRNQIPGAPAGTPHEEQYTVVFVVAAAVSVATALLVALALPRSGSRHVAGAVPRALAGEATSPAGQAP